MGIVDITPVGDIHASPPARPARTLRGQHCRQFRQPHAAPEARDQCLNPIPPAPVAPATRDLEHPHTPPPQLPQGHHPRRRVLTMFHPAVMARRRSRVHTRAMCNAYSLTSTRHAIVDLTRALADTLRLKLDDSTLPDDWQPRYAIRPSQPAPILYRAADKLTLTTAQFGLVAGGTKPGPTRTNARAEGLDRTWPWRMIAKDHRCLVLADGFFEPEKPAGDKSSAPWSYYVMGNRQNFLMAGLVNTASGMQTCAIVTVPANDIIVRHDRMPAIVAEDDVSAWLTPGPIPTAALQPFPAARMTAWRVPDAAKNSRLTDSPEMIAPVSEGLFDL